MLVSAVSNFIDTPSHGVKKALPPKSLINSKPVYDDFTRRKIKLATSLSMGTLFIGCILMAAHKKILNPGYQRHLYLLT